MPITLQRLQTAQNPPMQKDAHESGNSNELGLKTIGREIKKLLNKTWEKYGKKMSNNGKGLEKRRK